MEVTDYIPRQHFSLWYQIFKESNGRFINNPFAGKDCVLVHYFFEDVHGSKRMDKLFNSLITPVVETKRVKGLFNRIKMFIKSMFKEV